MQQNPIVDPKEYVIVRKRKKFRFAQFNNASNCFELDEWVRLDNADRFAHHLTVEIGAGTALFLVELARRYPDRNYIALDVKADRLQKGARAALELGLKNIWFVRARADQLLEVVSPGSVNQICLTFSDPFPKKRDAKRRLTAPRFLGLYQLALSFAKRRHLLAGGELRMKTDSHALFDWSLEQLVASGWTITELSYDLHASNLSDDYKILTTYEQKWLAEGLAVCFLSANRNGK